MELIVPNSKLEANERAAAAAKDVASTPVMSQLAGYIQSAFSAAEQHRQTSGVTDRILKSRRLKQGIYDSAKLAQIRSVGSSELFYNITEPKCEAFVAWMTDVFNSGTERPWGIEPTPIPSLSVEETVAVQEKAVAKFMGGGDIDPKVVKQFTLDLYDEALKLKVEQAKDKADRMADLIADQLAEGGFLEALAQFFDDLGECPAAILKGPVFHNHKRLKWTAQGVQVVDEVIPSWSCPDPFNFYPGPNAKDLKRSYTCEVIDFDRGELANMRGLPGWKDQAIEQALNENPIAGANGGSGTLFGEAEMRTFEQRETLGRGGSPDATVRAIEFWGNVQGKMLKEWGMPADKVKDDYAFHQVQCILVNNVVVRAVFNPHPLGRKPYYITSFIKNKNSLWGRASIPEKIEDCQEGVNVAQRNLLNNLAFGSGPQIAADIDAIPAAHIPTLHQQYPMKVWAFHGKDAPSSRNPIQFFQPNTNANELSQVAEFFEKKADDRTLIPRYVTGDQDMRGAGATASGLSMLMNAATRGIKRVIRNVDMDIIRPCIEAIYVFNMLLHDDDSVKGDAQVVPAGAVGMLVREQTQLRQQEFLNLTNNPTDMEIIGMEGRANLLRAVAKRLGLPEGDIVPSEEEMRMRMQQIMAAQQPQEPATPQPAQ